MNLKPESTAFVVVDIQEKLYAAVPGLAPFLPKVQMMLKAARELNNPVIVTEQYPRGLGNTLPELKELFLPEWPIIEKTDFSCWGVEAFRQELTAKKIKTVILTGIECHVCVQQTALDLLENGFDVVLAADTVSSRNSYDREIAIELMRVSGVRITTAESILFGMMRTAKHPAFKAVSILVR